MYTQLAGLPAGQERRVGDYILLETIGWGSFSSVWLARHTLTGAEVAVKVVTRQDCSDPFREVRSLQLLQHPNIVKLFEVITTEDELYLIEEHVSGGDLLTLLWDKGPMTEEEARHTFRQIISALQYCHQWHIAHRDLKPENILVDRDNNIKLADFGFSAQITEDRPFLCNFCGTFPYMAPEMLQREPHNEKVDVWSLGIVLYQMLTRTIPFEAETREEHKYNILRGEFPVPESLSLECQELLRKLLTLDPDERPTLDDIMGDRWLNTGQAEELRPYREPPWEGLNPQITEIMTKMGFEAHKIQTSVTEKKYDKIMGTYLILDTTPPKMKGYTIRVKPCPIPDPNINLSPTQGVQASGKKDRDSAISPADLGPRVPTPSAQQLVRKKDISLVIQGANMSATASRHESKNKTPPASREAKTITALPSREADTITALPSREADTITALPSREADTITALPSREADTTTALPSREAKTITALPSREADTITALPSREAKTITALPSREADTITALPSREAKTITALPSREADTITALPSREAKTITALPSREAKTITALPSREAETTTALPSREAKTITALPSREAKTITALPSREAETTTPPSSWEGRRTTPPTRVEAKTTTSVLGQKSWTATVSPAHPGDPRGSPITHSTGTSTSTSRVGGAPEETTSEICLQAAIPDGGSRAPSPGLSQGRQGVARRFFRSVLGLFCCAPNSHRPCFKRTRVKPI